MPLRDLNSFLVVSHEELATEQAYFDRVADVLRKRAELVASLPDEGTAASDLVARHVRQSIHRRTDELANTRSLVAGSFSDGQARRYVGRLALLDEDGEEVLLSWRSPAAAPFLHARTGSPQGLTNRRRYQLEEWCVKRIIDEYFDGRPRELHVEDEIIRDLRATRPGELSDVLATIESDQAAILEEPLEGVLVIDGGPGTGKTIVALMRLALHLGREPAGSEDLPLLVVGPTRAYVDYVGNVLPGLGEDDVAHASIDDIPSTDVRATRRDSRAVERVKGDARMAVVLRRAVWRSIRVADIVFSFSSAGSITVPAAVVASFVERAGRGVGYRAARETFRERVAVWVATYLTERDPRWARHRDLPSEIRKTAGFRTAVDKVWPTFTAHQFVRELLASPLKLGDAAGAELSGDEVQSLYRLSAGDLGSEPWTSADLPLVDEVEHVLDPRPTTTYRHVLVDEAQDLSPMQLRMIARRCPSRSITLIGDLVQATGPFPHRTWDTVTGPLLHTDATMARIRHLRYGYRVPRQVATIAEEILRRMDPDIDPPRFVGDGLGETRAASVGEAELLASVTSLVQNLLNQPSAISIGVIVPLGRENEVREALKGVGVESGGVDDIAEHVAVLPPHAARGLEFTHVVIVRPGEIVHEDSDGYKRLYISVTRCSEFLAVIHCGEWDDLRRPYTPDELRQAARDKLRVLYWMLCYIDRADCCSVIEMARRTLPAASVSDEEAAFQALIAIVESEDRLRGRLIHWVEDRFAEFGAKAPERP